MNNISVICSVYNSSKWLDVYLNAVNNQLLEKFNIVFIDAKSSDNSLNIIKNFKFRQGINVKIISMKNRLGVYEAWNLGILSTDSKYILNWNTDDLLYPSALVTYELYSKYYPDIDIFYGPCFVVNNQNYDSIIEYRNWPHYSHNTLLNLCICGPFPMLKKSSLEAAGLFETKYKSSGDYATWLKLSKQGYKFKRIPEALGVFYYRPESVSIQNLDLAQQEDREIQNIYK